MSELRQRAVKWTDEDWRLVQESSKAAGKTAAEWVRERTTAGIDGETIAALRAHIAKVEAQLSLRLAKAAEDAGNDSWISGLEERIAERAQVLGRTPEDWVRGLVTYTLDRPVPQSAIPVVKGKTPDNDERRDAILAESARREAANIANGGKPWAKVGPSPWASMTHAPKGSPNLTWDHTLYPSGPPAWMTAPTTREGMSKTEALAAGMQAAAATMRGER